MIGGEITHTDVNDTKPHAQESFRDIKPQKVLSAKELNIAVDSEFERAAKENEKKNEQDNNEKSGLSDEEKVRIKEETGWTDQTIDHIGSWEQYEIYKNADLHEEVIDGRACLIKDIDMDYVDPKTGMTNRELMAKGWSPIDAKTGEKIELHHMGQEYDAPFAELCENSEHGDGNHSILHTKTENSWRNNSELDNHYSRVDKPNHWIERSTEV